MSRGATRRACRLHRMYVCTPVHIPLARADARRPLTPTFTPPCAVCCVLCTACQAAARDPRLAADLWRVSAALVSLPEEDAP